MKREKRLTRQERKETAGGAAPRGAVPGAAGQHKHTHIHCIACGKHLDPEIFGEPDGADFVRCEHGTDYPTCVACMEKSRALLAEHDRSGQPVKSVAAWH